MLPLFVAALLLAIQQPGANVRDHLRTLQQQAQTARKSHQYRRYLDAVLQIRTLLNDSPEITESIALAYTQLDDPVRAIAALNHFAGQGQADDDLLAGKDAIFAPLHNLPAYRAVLRRFAQNKTAISRATTAFTLPDSNLLTEDLDFDPGTRSFLITSVLENKIVRLSPDGKLAAFAASPSRWPMLAIKIDPARKLVWATEVALDGFASVPKADQGRSAVLCFQLASGSLIRRIEAPPHSALGDMALTPHGDPLLTDGGNGAVYLLTANQLKPINTTDFISPQTAAVLPDGLHAFVPDYSRGIALLDLRTGRPIWLNGSEPKPVAINGIDGLYLYRNSLLLTQNGVAPERVARLQLDPSLHRILSTEVVERATPTLGDPTHGVLVGGAFYYIANSGWANLDDRGRLKPGAHLTPARIMQYKLPGARIAP